MKTRSMSSMNHLIIFFFSSILLVQQAPYKIKQVNRKFPVTLELRIFLLFSRHMPPNSLLLQLDETTMDLCFFLVIRGCVQKFAPLFRVMEDGNVNLLVPDSCERVLQSFKKGLHSNDSNKLASEK